MAIAINVSVGTKVWYALGGGPLIKGKVCHILEADSMDGEKNHPKMYIIVSETAVDPVYQIRCPLTISDDPDKPLGIWRTTPKALARIEEIRKKHKTRLTR